MIAYFYWPDCRLIKIVEGAVLVSWDGIPKDSFWVGVAPEVVHTQLRQYLSPMDTELLNRALAEEGWEEQYVREGEFYFLVARDLTRIQIHPAGYPYSGVWNGSQPFIPIGPRNQETGKPPGLSLQGLEALKGLDLWQDFHLVQNG